MQSNTNVSNTNSRLSSTSLSRSTTSKTNNHSVNRQHQQSSLNLLNISSNNTIPQSASTTAASTPHSIADPNDEIWLEFLSSLQTPTPNELSNTNSLNSNSCSNNHFNPNNYLNNSSSINNEINKANESNPSKIEITQNNYSSTSNYLNYDINNFIDNDDPDQDPDFTVCLDNYDLDDPDYVDDWFQVPKKEALLLVKDAIDFCDSVPIVCELDQRNSKLKSTRKISSELNLLDKANQIESDVALTNTTFSHRNKLSKYTSSTSSQSNNQTNSNNLNFEQTNAQKAPKSSLNEKESQTENFEKSSYVDNGKSQTNDTALATEKDNSDSQIIHKNNSEFIPEFNEIQRKQLDEQLRNHVQLLTQTCLLSVCSFEYRSIFEEACKLLEVLDNMNKPACTENQINSTNDKNNEKTQNESANCLKGLLSPNFEIINLKESIEIVDGLKKLDKAKLSELDLKKNNGMPTKFLELILTSPVFYNVNLIPICKYKYQSHFKRSQFSESEKVLLIMGFNKFKHLPKNECCECIKQHLLPQRTCEDIKKQLSNISNSEHRQQKLKELLKKQKMNNKMNSKNFEFIKEIDYKSPLEQSDLVQLPSMYTMMIERLKMANLLRESKNHLKIINNKKSRKTSNQESNSSTKTNSSEANNPCSLKRSRRSSSSSSLSSSFDSTILSSRSRSQSPQSNSQSDFSLLLNEDRSIASSSPNNKHISSTINQTPKHNSDRSNLNILNCVSSPENVSRIKSIKKISLFAETIKNKTNENSNITTQNSPVSHISITPIPLTSTCSNNIIQLSSANFSNSLLPPLQPITILKPIQPTSIAANQPNQQPFLIPAGFAGTILYQPTIHIHTGTNSNAKNSNNNINNLSNKKYRQIVPKK